MKAIVTWLLSAEGRRASLNGGGNGWRVQSGETEIDMVPELLYVNRDGSVHVRYGHDEGEAQVADGHVCGRRFSGGADDPLATDWEVKTTYRTIESDDVIDADQVFDLELARRLRVSAELAAAETEVEAKNRAGAEARRLKSAKALQAGRWALRDVSRSREPIWRAFCVDVDSDFLPTGISAKDYQDLADVKTLELVEKAAAKRTRAEEDRRRQEAAKTEAIASWIREHGSQRLCKILDAGLLDRSLNVYYDERLALEMPGWSWLGDPNYEDILNPSEDALDALAKAPKGFVLKYLPDVHHAIVVGGFLGREVCMEVEEGE